jgi:AcrR family transcriptional regulator
MKPDTITKGERTRAQILEAGFDLARVVGVTGVTVGGLAEATGMSKSGLWSHFGSKTALESSILDYAAERFTDEVVRPAWREKHIRRRLGRLFDNWLAWGGKHHARGGCVFVAAAAELDDRDTPTRDCLVGIQRQWMDTLANVIDRGVDRGELPAGLDGRQAAHELYAIVMGFYHAERLLGDPQAEARARASFERLFGPEPVADGSAG